MTATVFKAIVAHRRDGSMAPANDHDKPDMRVRTTSSWPATGRAAASKLAAPSLRLVRPKAAEGVDSNAVEGAEIIFRALSSIKPFGRSSLREARHEIVMEVPPTGLTTMQNTTSLRRRWRLVTGNRATKRRA